MFTRARRQIVHEHVLSLARNDARVVAGAVIGSRAAGREDRWSDIDLTFAVADDRDVEAVVADWSDDLRRSFDAVELFDLTAGSTLYRVFMLPGALQVDLSFTPMPLYGPRGGSFEPLFGPTGEATAASSPSRARLFGMGIHHAVRARVSLERGRRWQAEYWISETRNCAFALACLSQGLDPGHGRGYDQLPPETTAPFERALVPSLDRSGLLGGLAAAIDLLFRHADGLMRASSWLERDLRGLAADAPLTWRRITTFD